MATRVADAEAVASVMSKLEADLVGVVSLAEWEGTRLAQSARRLLPSAQSVVVVGMELYPELLTHVTPDKIMGEAAPRELYAAHSEYLDGRLTKALYDVARASRHQGLRALPIPSRGCPVDGRTQTAIFSLKHAAEAAGLGSIGKSSLVITPQFGPRVRLAAVLTEAALAPSGRSGDNLCLDCQDCVTTCPVGALAEPRLGEAYSINKFACCAFRGGAGACSECMKVCPVGA